MAKQEQLSYLPKEVITLSTEFVDLLQAEVRRSESMYPPMHSLMEAASVIREEFEEFWDAVKVKDANRDYENLAEELVQTAAMCMRAYNDIVKLEIDEMDRKGKLSWEN